VSGLGTLLLLADGRFPAGGHAHSGGLEPAVGAGRLPDLAALDAFLRGRLATAGLVAAAFAASACAAGADPAGADPAGADPAGADPAGADPAGADPAGADPAGADPAAAAGEVLGALDEAMEARIPSPAQRRASRAQGRALLRAGRAIWDPPAGFAAGLSAAPHQPVALGTVAAAAGLDPDAAALAAAHGTVAGPAGAAVRLLGLDPYAVHRLLARLAPECDRVAARGAAHVAAGGPPDDLPAASAPLLDVGAEVHALWEVRLFAS
jgi:urease accessory protein